MKSLKAALRGRLRPYLRRVVKSAARRTRPLRYRLLFEHGMRRSYEAMIFVRDRTLGQHLRVEACSVCQLKCPACSTATGKNKRNVVGWGMLKLPDFVRLLDDNPRLARIELSNWGEIMLNPYLGEMLREAHERGVVLQASNGVNLNHVKPATLEALVRYGLERMTVSIDGASHATYKQYRRGGSFHRVIEHIETINRLKARYATRKPELTWQFVVFGHNEHEIEQARVMAAALDMKFKPKLNHTPALSPVRDRAHVRARTGLGAASRGERRGRGKPACSQLWDSPQVNWDGELLGCCVNKWGSFGNVFERGLEATLRGERYRYAKRMVLGQAPAREDIPCVQCKVYRREVLGEGHHDERVILKRWENRPTL